MSKPPHDTHLEPAISALLSSLAEQFLAHTPFTTTALLPPPRDPSQPPTQTFRTESVIKVLEATGKLPPACRSRYLVDAAVEYLAEQEELYYVEFGFLRRAVEAALKLRVVDEALWGSLLGEMFRPNRTAQFRKGLPSSELGDLLTQLFKGGFAEMPVLKKFLLEMKVRLGGVGVVGGVCGRCLR